MSIYPISLDVEDYVLLQDSDDYAFSQDSVFLANLAKIGKNDAILDLGCGNGVLATLALCKKNAKCATGIEIQSDVANLAIESAKLNKLDDKLTIINDDVRNIRNLVGAESFDVVLCNPPYFCGAQDSKKAISRSESVATLEDFVKATSFALRFGGDCYFVIKVDRLAQIVTALSNNNLEPKDLTLVYPKLSSGVDIVIVKARKGGKVGLKTHTFIVMDEMGNYTDQYKEIYG